MNRLVLPFLAGVVAVACSDGRADPAVTPAAPPAALDIRAESLPAFLPVMGTVAARRRAEVATRLMARIVAVPVDVGAHVRTGDVLVRLGLEDVAAGRLRAEAALTAAAATREEAARQAARMDTLYAQDAVAQVQRDQAHLGLAQADAQWRMAQAALDDVVAAEGYAALRAPFAGIVVARTADPGDLAAPGTPLVVVESDGPRDAVLAVPADVAAGMQPGDHLRVERAGRVAAAAVRAVARGADPVTRTVEVRAALPADWPTGVSLTALVPTGSRAGVAIPDTLVVRRGQLTGVRVLEGDRIVLRWVRLGRTLPDGRSEVLAGLTPGDRVTR